MQELLNELEDMQMYLNADFPREPDVIQERGRETVVFMARAGHIHTQAKDMLRRAMNDFLTKSLIKQLSDIGGLSLTVQNAIVKNILPDLQHIVDWSGEIERLCSKQVEWCRTEVSKEKERMKTEHTGGGGLIQSNY
jgi:hypothetical protein